jgi:hypothetical protein
MQFSEMRIRPESVVPVELRRQWSFQKIASHRRGSGETVRGEDRLPSPAVEIVSFSGVRRFPVEFRQELLYGLRGRRVRCRRLLGRLLRRFCLRLFLGF